MKNIKQFNFVYIEDTRKDFSLLKINNEKDLMIVNIMEVDQMYPLYEHDKDFFYRLTQYLDTFFTKKLFYVTCDLDFENKLKKWLIGFEHDYEIIPIIFPYAHINLSNKRFLENGIKEFSINDNVVIRDDEKTEYEKKYNFVTLTTYGKLIRALFIDKFYKHENFIYSFNPFLREYDNVEENGAYEITNPVEWVDDYSVLMKEGYKFNVMDALGFQNNNYNFENGFDLKNHMSVLTELDEVYQKEKYFFDKYKKIIGNKNISKIINDEKNKNEYYINDRLLTNQEPYVPIEYIQSNIDVVLETYIGPGVNLTSKTLKPIFYQKPFIVLGAKKIHYYLKKYGFKLYNEIFDYSFDELSSTKDRFDSIVNQVNNLIDYDPKDLSKKLEPIKHKVKFNSERIKYLRSKIGSKTKYKTLYLNYLNGNFDWEKI